MLGRTYDNEVCSIARSLEIVGERWSLLIIRNALFAGVTRFGDFQKRLGVATNVLTTRLDGFVEAGIMSRDSGSGGVEYHLTDKGRDLRGVLIAFTDWGDRWQAPAGRPIIYRHDDCSGEVHSSIRCDACGEEPDAVTASKGPGMPEEKWSHRTD
ncbi:MULTISPECIES: winged helix-turn-helix transcriptional regulator [unclassified Brevibacterium]|uniref:winged helix-turn-helix transcriptional regulator n=1 Tax=unclassified Brevibacterium TaxID=2614124 RepID=UPI0010804E22|nr:MULTISPECIES: helix-turn-helix domain-containing protein [unclassified Brevibacterium]TGD10710.1 transcriptional regulator [Brevibacterium sp. S111]